GDDAAEALLPGPEHEDGAPGTGAAFDARPLPAIRDRQCHRGQRRRRARIERVHDRGGMHVQDLAVSAPEPWWHAERRRSVADRETAAMDVRLIAEAVPARACQLAV